MSECYVTEPSTRGKVTLNTSHGPLDVELWSKECPKACRNFIQLCLEGYYDNVLFYRIIPDFIVQTGDPTGRGNGGESIYGASSFPNEFHSRLKYRYRGLVGVASRDGVPNSNGSEFFITLARADTLNGKHTLFGKVTGRTLYNLLSIAAVTCDSSDRPLQPPVIQSAEVLWNPFDDIVPRIRADIQPVKEEIDTKPEMRDGLKKLKPQLLSFGGEDEETDNAFLKDTASKRERVMASAHDILIDDPVLRPADEDDNTVICSKVAPVVAARMHSDDLGNRDNSTELEVESRGVDEYKTIEELRESERKSRRYEELKLRKDIMGVKTSIEREAAAVENSDLLKDSEKIRQIYLQRKRDTSKTRRHELIVTEMEKFRKRIKSHSHITVPEDQKDNEVLGIVPAKFGAFPDLDTEVIESDGTWLATGGLKFSVDSSKAYEMVETNDNLMIFDPLAASGKYEADDVERRRHKQRQLPSLKNTEIRERW